MGFLSFANPMLLWGGLLVASPIIIHLLSKRRFVVVEWAAMDFLLDAERKNRRRIRLEHLLLLLLRCLAVLLLALLVARPVFDPSGMGLGHLGLGPTEHLVVLDDSPSMGVKKGNATAFGEARDALATYARELATTRGGDSLTVLLTSRPEQPLFNGLFLSSDNLADAEGAIGRLEPSSLPAAYDRALLEAEKLLEKTEGPENKRVCFATDLRARDWPLEQKSGGLPARLRELLAKRKGAKLHFADFGETTGGNLAVTVFQQPAETLAAGVPAKFEVTVANYGETDADGVEVEFCPTNSLPLKATADSIPPGGSRTISFTYTFSEPGHYDLRAALGPDALPADNERFLAVEVTKGVKVLLVDGEPGARKRDGETFYLGHALAPQGETPSGYDVETVQEAQFAGLALNQYQYICLCNLFTLTEERAKALREWVADGGGLAFFLGDLCEPESYNGAEALAPGLFPLRLESIEGDETGRNAVGIRLDQPNNPVVRVFGGENNPLLKSVKIFRYWKASLAAGKEAPVTVASFDALDNPPAIVEAALGKGKIAVVLTAADAEWGAWVDPYSYPIMMQEMARSLARSGAGEWNLPVGAPLRFRYDPARYGLSARVFQPGKNDYDQLQAEPLGDGKTMQLSYEETKTPGIYALELERRDGEAERALFAVNLDGEEGNLARADFEGLKAATGTEGITRAAGQLKPAAETAGDKLPLWRPLAWALLAVLLTESLLAWWFGTRR